MTSKTPTIVHVNRTLIGMNTKDGGNRPVYRVQFPNGKVRYGSSVEFLGGVRATKQTPDNKLKCGARVWLETDGDVIITDECSYQEAAYG